MAESKENINVLITGGAGFIGHHMVEHFHRQTDWNIIIIDKLNYSTNGLDKLRNTGLLTSPRIRMFTWDLIVPLSIGMKKEFGNIDYIIHLAAYSHVDDSIENPVPFIHNNVTSTVNMLQYARELNEKGCLKKFFYFSTDEVFGGAPEGTDYNEDDRHRPTNPYSASKSASEMIVMGYENSYTLPIIITNLMNVIGERQHPEKFIPKCMKYIREGRIVPIHSDPTLTKPGSRHYIHARNVAGAILFLVENGVIGEKYNIVGEREVDNLEMAQSIANFMHTELKYEMVNFHETRPGHDVRYSLAGEKLARLGWSPPVDFDNSLRKTVEWTLMHPEWLE